MVQGSSINTYSFTQLLTVERIPQCEVLELFSWARRDIFSLNSSVTWCKLVSQFIDYLLAKNIFCFLPLLDLFSALYLSFSLRSATSLVFAFLSGHISDFFLSPPVALRFYLFCWCFSDFSRIFTI